MGNFTSALSSAQGHSREGEEARDRKVNKTWPPVDVTWANFQERRRSPYNTEIDDEMALNGYIFAGVCIPEDVLEIILALINPEDILNCAAVCRSWKDLTTRKSYWKRWFDRQGVDWSIIPDHVKVKPQAWLVFHAEVRHQAFTKNFIRNHSGIVRNEGGRGDLPQGTFEDWEIFKNGGHRWILENPVIGCDPLPEDPLFENSTSAWVTSYQPCSKWTQIELWKIGLTPPVLATCLPFSLNFSQMYAVRFDCGGIFRWTLRCLDKKDELIKEFEYEYRLSPQLDWHTATHSFAFTENQKDDIGELKSAVFMHEGKDSQGWAGHYGVKFARSCVRFQFDAPNNGDEVGIANADNLETDD